MASQPQRKANVRLAWILASTALAFALGFIARYVWFAH
ncbi:MAG TPA: cytochrome oxidase small assembly protein [Burkholderiaceae bacterium]|nr:cytochrome oxidase small assembly protein [Burkholderiaceae bacterium]